MVARSRRPPTRTVYIGDNGGRLRFGGGLNTISAPTDVNDMEAIDGFNFLLTRGDTSFNVRTGVQKVLQAPNDTSIVGFASLEDASGNVSLVLQAGGTVYKWDGTNATNVGTCNASARLRGMPEANWLIGSTPVSLITDIAGIETVKYWDGTNFDNVNFTKNNGANSYGNFKAKYCCIHEERALYGNIIDSTGNAYPHLLVGSRLDNYADISTSDRASSAIGAADPWYLTTTDLKPIAGIVSAFGQIVLPSLHGRFHILNGTTPADFNVQLLYTGLGVNDLEAIIATGNDVVYATQGSILSLNGVLNYGNVESNNIGIYIEPTIQTYPNWRITYNKRRYRLYCFPTTINNCFVANMSIAADGQVSPWMRWRTNAEHDFQPALVFTCKHPGTKLEETFITDNAGGLYLLESDVYADSMEDASTTGIDYARTSKILVSTTDERAYHMDGFIEYAPKSPATVEVLVTYMGTGGESSAQSMLLLSSEDAAYWGDPDLYFGGGYFGSGSTTKLIRQRYGAAGRSDMFNIKISGTAEDQVRYTAIGIRNETVD